MEDHGEDVSVHHGVFDEEWTSVDVQDGSLVYKTESRRLINK